MLLGGAWVSLTMHWTLNMCVCILAKRLNVHMHFSSADSKNKRLLPGCSVGMSYLNYVPCQTRLAVHRQQKWCPMVEVASCSYKIEIQHTTWAWSLAHTRVAVLLMPYAWSVWRDETNSVLLAQAHPTMIKHLSSYGVPSYPPKDNVQISLSPRATYIYQVYNPNVYVISYVYTHRMPHKISTPTSTSTASYN